MNAEQLSILHASIKRLQDDAAKLQEYVAKATEDDFGSDARDLRMHLNAARVSAGAATVYLEGVIHGS